jgi:hypothetical protein
MTEVVESGDRTRYRDEEITWLPFSGLAVVALCFAIPALLTIGFPVLAVSGFVALVTGFIAMRRCGEGRKMSGYRVAQFAVFLATAGIVMGLGHRFGKRGWLAHVSWKHEQRLIDYIHNDLLEELHSTCLAAGSRPGEGTDLVQFYTRKDVPAQHMKSPVSNINFWLSVLPMSRFCEDELNGTFVYESLIKSRQEGREWKVTHRYLYQPKSTALEPLRFDFEMTRQDYVLGKRYLWRSNLRWVPTGIPEGAKPELGQTRETLEPRKYYKRKAASLKAEPVNPSPESTPGDNAGGGAG